MRKPTHMTMRARTTRMRAARLLALVALALVASSLAPTPSSASASSRPTGEDPQDTTTTTAAGGNNGSNADSGCTAAQTLGYTNATFDDDFEGSSLDTESWSPYTSGSAHRWGQGQVTEEGRRRPEQITVQDGVLKINGVGASPQGSGSQLGDTGGMEMVDGKQHGYGLWEARVKIPQNVVNYHSVLILWPSGTEINFMEVLGESGQQISGREVQGYAHMDDNQRQASTSVSDDGWHNWAVEWIEGKITFYRDGQEWFTTESALTGQAGMTIQLDWFPWTQGGQDVRNTTTDAELQIDWVRSYEVANKGNAGTCSGGSGNNTTCPSGQANSLGQCTQPTNNNNGSDNGNGSTGSTCGWYQIPDPQVQQRLFPNLPQGSVAVFNVCVDSTGLVTPVNGGCSGSGTGSQTAPTADNQSQGAQDRCIGPVSVGTGSSTDPNTLHPPCQSTGTTQPADNQTGQSGQNGRNSSANCYRQLPQGFRIDASLATALMLSDATAALNGWRPDLIAKPEAGDPAIIDEPTFVCVSNFPSGTNFPGAISVGGHGGHGSTTTTSSTTTTTTTRPPTQTFAGSPGGEAPSGSGDTTTTTTTTRPGGNTTPTGDDGTQTGSFQPGIVGDLSASQQACLQAQGQTPQVDGDSSCQNQNQNGNGSTSGDPDEDDSGEQEAGSNPQTFRGADPDPDPQDTTTTTTTTPTSNNCTNNNGSSTNPLQSVSDMICGQTTTPTTPGTGSQPGQSTTGTPISTQPVTDDQTGSQVGACMSMQLYPVIRWDPGDGSEIVECAAPGSLVPENASQEQADAAADEAAACKHIYTRRTGSGSQQGVQGWRAGDERPSEWPGRVSVVWRADTDACIVHAAQGSTNYAAGASHPATNPLNSTLPIDLTSLGEGGQAPDTSQTGEIPGQQGTYTGQPAAGIDAESREVQSPWTPLPRSVDEGHGQNTAGGS